MNRKIVIASVTLLVGLLFVASMAPAGTINYVEAFSTTGAQATADGQTFANYPNWTYYEPATATNAAEAQVDTAGTLHIVTGTQWYNRARTTSQAIAGVSQFDVSTEPLTVSAELMGNGTAGNYNTGLSIGSIDLYFFPDFNNGGNGLYRIAVNNSQVVSAGLGWVPTANTEYTTTMSIVQQGTNYKLDYSISGLVGGVQETFSSTYTVATATAGSLTSVGFRADGSGATADNAYFSGLTVSQVPEPGTLALLATGLIGLLCYAWRRRK